MYVNCSSIRTWIVQNNVFAKTNQYTGITRSLTRCYLNNLARYMPKDALLILVYIKLLNLLVNRGVSVKDLKSRQCGHTIIDKV